MQQRKNKMKTFYIHGYGSSPKSQTFVDMQAAIPDIECLTYDSNAPMSSILSIVNTLKSIDEPIHIIASSLGGWYAERIASIISVSLTLYNPLKKYVLPESVTNLYRDVLINPNVERTVVLSKDDDVVSPDNAMVKYANIANMVITEGGHRMTPTNLGIIVDDWNFRKNQLG
jgi:predicted esterase YcpF (UPF0227 family)